MSSSDNRQGTIPKHKPTQGQRRAGNNKRSGTTKEIFELIDDMLGEGVMGFIESSGQRRVGVLNGVGKLVVTSHCTKSFLNLFKISYERGESRTGGAIWRDIVRAFNRRNFGFGLKACLLNPTILIKNV
ncbi:hypothetical protein HAX54_026542 [Datura stramonium]|uniref:Uncharacterized protein n=1 Tax=Datura stramonium TaxID=4076 RepID=A0ABS8V388_DATST|nr:hypothetical protein [Datura stramonium]